MPCSVSFISRTTVLAFQSRHKTNSARATSKAPPVETTRHRCRRYAAPVIAEVTGTGRKRGIAEIIDYHSGAEIACAFVAQNQRVEAADAARIPMNVPWIWYIRDGSSARLGITPLPHSPSASHPKPASRCFGLRRSVGVPTCSSRHAHASAAPETPAQ
jgi:hypothetical protein